MEELASKNFNFDIKKLPPVVLKMTKSIEKKAKKNERFESQDFIVNNWETHGNPLLEKLKAQGGFIFFLSDGTIYFREKRDSIPKRIKQKNILENLFASAVGKPSIQLFKDTKEKPADVYPNELDIINIKFSLRTESEFYTDEYNNKNWTKFKPSLYLQINKIDENFKMPYSILFLISNLCKHSEEEFTYVLNWLAGFAQTLTKPKTALVFVGKQGTGKNLFVEFILVPIFGKDFVSIIDNERLNSRFNGSILHEKVLNIFNELSLPSNGTKMVVKNKLKAIITDSTIQVENKGVDPFQADIVAPSIILSNEQVPIDIEEGDRRYYVVSTGNNLKKQGIDTNLLVELLIKELFEFATFLNFFDVDWKLYDADAPMTQIKEAIILNSNNPEKLFVTAINDKDILFFDDIRETHSLLYAELKKNFANNEVLYDSLVKYYQAVYEESRVLSSKKILSNLRLIDPIMFAPVKQNANISRSSNGNKYLKLEK